MRCCAASKPSSSSWRRTPASISANRPAISAQRSRSGPTRVRTSSCLMSEASRPSAEKLPGMARHQHARDADLVGQGQRVHGAGAAEGDQREVARVVAALDGDLADGGGHAGHGDAHDALGQRVHRHDRAHARGQIGDGVPRARRVDRDAAAQPARRADAAQHHVGVGHGGLGPAQAVGGRAGDGARAARPHLQAAVQVEPRQRAPAGADRVHVDLRHLHGKRADHAVRGGQRREIAHQADVGGRAAHVVGDQVAHAGDAAHEARLAHSAGRAREDRLDRQTARGLGRHHPAAGGHGEHAVGVAHRAQLLLEAAQVAVHQGLQVGVEDRRGEALELAVLGHHVGRARHGHARAPALGGIGDAPLVRRVQVGVEQADGDRLGAGGQGRALRVARFERITYKCRGPSSAPWMTTRRRGPAGPSPIPCPRCRGSSRPGTRPPSSERVGSEAPPLGRRP